MLWSRMKTRIVVGILILVGTLLAAVFAVSISVQTFGLIGGRGLADRIVVLGLLAFAGPLLAFGFIRYEADRVLERGEIRSAIAIAMTVMYLILLPFSLVPEVGLDFNGEFLKNFHFVYVSVIAFYFGTRILEEYTGKRLI